MNSPQIERHLILQKSASNSALKSPFTARAAFLPEVFVLKHESSIFRSFILPWVGFGKRQACPSWPTCTESNLTSAFFPVCFSFTLLSVSARSPCQENLSTFQPHWAFLEIKPAKEHSLCFPLLGEGPHPFDANDRLRLIDSQQCPMGYGEETHLDLLHKFAHNCVPYSMQMHAEDLNCTGRSDRAKWRNYILPCLL